MTARSSLAGAVVALAITSPLTVPVAAHAEAGAAPGAEFSSDAAVWSSRLPALFPDVLLVPGGRETAVFWVRNAAEEPAELWVVVADSATDPAGALLREWLTVSINGRPTAPGDVWSEEDLAPSEAFRVAVEVEMSAAAPPDTRARSADVITAVILTGLTDDGAGPAPGTTPAPGTRPAPGTGRDDLQRTGVNIALLVVGGALVLGGASLRRGRP